MYMEPNLKRQMITLACCHTSTWERESRGCHALREGEENRKGRRMRAPFSEEILFASEPSPPRRVVLGEENCLEW